MTSAEVWAAVARRRKVLAAFTALCSLVAWSIFVVSWQVGTWVEVLVAPTALYGAVSLLVSSWRVMLLGERMQHSGWNGHFPAALGALTAGLWIARFSSPWMALAVIWTLIACCDAFMIWNHEATNPEVPRVSWLRIFKHVAISGLWNVGGTLLGLGVGRVL